MTLDPICVEFDAALSPAERQLIESARQFAQQLVAPQAAGWQRERKHPTDVLREACRARFASIELPAEQGGLGLRFSAKLRVVEELAKADFGFAFSLVNHHNALLRVARSPSTFCQSLVPAMLVGELIGCAAYTEPAHGSDLAKLGTTALRTPNGWRLEGAKSWTTNAAVSDVLLTLAQTDAELGWRGIGLFVVDARRPGFVREQPYEVSGAYAIGAGGFQLRGYEAPLEALLDPPGEAFRHALGGINGARCYVAAMCAGMLDEALQIAVRYASRRQAFGQAIVEFQGLRWSLVDAQNDLAALRLLAYRAARLLDAGHDADEAAAAAKKFAGDRVLVHLAGCAQTLGANGLREEYPLMRHLVAARIACIADGTTQMMNERLGKLLVRRYTEP